MEQVHASAVNEPLRVCAVLRSDNNKVTTPAGNVTPAIYKTLYNKPTRTDGHIQACSIKMPLDIIHLGDTGICKANVHVCGWTQNSIQKSGYLMWTRLLAHRYSPSNIILDTKLMVSNLLIIRHAHTFPQEPCSNNTTQLVGRLVLHASAPSRSGRCP